MKTPKTCFRWSLVLISDSIYQRTLTWRCCCIVEMLALVRPAPLLMALGLSAMESTGPVLGVPSML